MKMFLPHAYHCFFYYFILQVEKKKHNMFRPLGDSSVTVLKVDLMLYCIFLLNVLELSFCNIVFSIVCTPKPTLRIKGKDLPVYGFDFFSDDPTGTHPLCPLRIRRGGEEMRNPMPSQSDVDSKHFHYKRSNSGDHRFQWFHFKDA